jgi:hypothetical protein
MPVDWTKVQIDLSGYKGSKIRVQFVMDADGGGCSDGWYIDKVQVSEPSLAPQIAVSPVSIDTTLDPGQQVNIPLLIENLGNAILQFTIEEATSAIQLNPELQEKNNFNNGNRKIIESREQIPFKFNDPKGTLSRDEISVFPPSRAPTKHLNRLDPDPKTSSYAVDIPWLSVSPTAGTISPAQAMTIQITIDSDSLIDNTYSGYLVVNSNDIDRDPIVVPISMTVSHVVLISPIGGEELEGGSLFDITWDILEQSNLSHITILFSEDRGQSFSIIQEVSYNDTSFAWTVPNVNSDSCMVRIEAIYAGDIVYVDESDSVFSISSSTTDIPSDREQTIPSQYILYQNYPNPFNPTTSIAFDVPKGSHVTIRVYDISGRLVNTLTDRWWAPGHHTLTWAGLNQIGNPLPSGMYLLRMESDDYRATKKLILLK